MADVRRIADEFLAELAAAERATGGWRDRGASDELASEALSRALRKLEATGLQGGERRLAAAEFRKVAGETLKAGWLQHRAWEKPCGYAGDFELFEAICERRLADDPLGRAFDEFFQRQPAAEGVRERTSLLAARIASAARSPASAPCRVACIGCGPALDAREALEVLSPGERERLSLRLLDIDPAAVRRAEQRLAPFAPAADVLVERANLFRLARQPQSAAALAGSRLITCPGLFDYLQDRDAAELLSLIYKSLAPGGEAVAFNFAPDHGSRAYMEWIAQWYLVYRDQGDMRRLAERAGIPGRDVWIESLAGGTIQALAVVRRQ